MSEAGIDEAVHRFLLDNIDSVPQIEALLLLWESRPKTWTSEELAHRLYLDLESVSGVLAPLVRQGFVVARREQSTVYSYIPESDETDRLIQTVATAYRRNLVRATTIIHSKSSSGVREFARA